MGGDDQYERFWKYNHKENNKHDFFMVWADIILSGKKQSIFYQNTFYKKLIK